MASEYGIFNEEGCLERDFYSRGAAEVALLASYSEDGAWVGEMSIDQDGVEAGFEEEEEEEEGEEEE